MNRNVLKCISTKCCPMISLERNYELEQIYLNSSKNFQEGKETTTRKRKAQVIPVVDDTGANDPNNQESTVPILDTLVNEGGNVEKVENNSDLERKRLPKKKVALILSYCGTGYQGMQINPDVPSIELDLHKALAEAQCVSVDNQMNPVKCGFQRCARTDKGVHAAGQVVSLKLILDNDMIPRINSFLPKQIRVWDVCRVNNGFNSKNQCDSRNYEYLLPTYCLQPVDSALYPNSNVGKRHGLQGTILSGTIVDIPVPTREELDKKRMYRICESKLLLLKDLLQQFVGTRNHFNFTVGKEFKDASAKRFIMNWNVGTPFVRDGIEWVSCRVEGQSFMLHQIRKMMGLVIMMIRTETPIKLFDTCFTSQRINIPKAPALGLLLQHPNFHIYNRDFGGKDERNPIDFNQYKVSI